MGEQPETIKRLLRDDVETLAAFEAAILNPVGNPIINNVNNCKPEVGNSKAYTVRRLAKNHPELFDKVKSGELMKPPTPQESGRAGGKVGGRGNKKDETKKGSTPDVEPFKSHPNTEAKYRKVAANKEKIDEYFEAKNEAEEPEEMTLGGFIRFATGTEKAGAAVGVSGPR